MRIDSIETRERGAQLVSNLTTNELVKELVCRYIFSNGFSFIQPEHAQALREALNDPETSSES